MTSTAPSPALRDAPVAAPPLPLRPYVLAWLALATGGVLQLELRLFSAIRDLPWDVGVRLAVERWSMYLSATTAVMLAAYAIDTWLPPRAWRIAVRWLAMLAAAFLSAVIVHELPAAEPVAVQLGIVSSRGALTLHVTWMFSALGLLATLCIDHWQSRRIAEARVQRVQEELLRSRRLTLQSRLQALQARLDPQLLFASLRRIGALYRQSWPDAERSLTDLSDYLRAALPRLQTLDSTLGREFELAHAYVRLVSQARERTFTLRASLPERLQGHRFPAGLLLPLLRGAFVEDAVPDDELRLEAEAEGQRVRVRLAAPRPFDPLDVAQARAIVAELYGAAARVVEESPPPAVPAVVIEVPLDG